MDKLEKFVKENRDIFDENEPSIGHFDRFEEKIDTRFGHQKAGMNRSFLLKIAAGLIILMTVTVFLFDFAARQISKYAQNNSQGKDLPVELQEAVNYYDDAASNHLNKIRKLACCGQDSRKIYSLASGELDALDANTVELRNTLKENPGDDRVQSALLRNQRMKETVLNNMISKMKSAKK
jgi:hypothetical protein